MLKGRLLFDVTKGSKQPVSSGLLRVSNCLRRELPRLLGDAFLEVVWSRRGRTFRPLDRRQARNFAIARDDTLLTSELFCESERPGIEAFLTSRTCHSYAIFHDAIPLRHPEFAWPKSALRHPRYMKMLALFDGVFAVSQHSAMILEEYWEWLGFEYAPSVKSVQLGADGIFEDPAPPKEGALQPPLTVMLLAIIEPRKGQDVALRAFRRLWEEGVPFRAEFVGRVNPHFGKPIERAIKQAIGEGLPLRYHGQISDDALKRVFAASHLTVFPSRAEGCGLPLLESLWQGLPVLSSYLHSTRESARFGGCEFVPVDDADTLVSRLRALAAEPCRLAALAKGIRQHLLPRWSDTAKEIVDHLVADCR